MSPAFLLLFGTMAAALVACAGDDAARAQEPAGGPTADESAVSAAPGSDGDFTPACLGERLSGRLVKGLPYATLAVGRPDDARSGAFLLDWGTTRSTIDLLAFAPSAPPASGCDPTYLGERCTFEGFSFFGPWGPVTFTTADHRGDGNEGSAEGVRQAGILGTDFFATAVYAIDFRSGDVFRASAGAACDASTLDAKGYSAHTSAGFFAHDFGALRPLTDVVPDADPSFTVPNVPTVPLRVGSVSAHTQLDTGFADSRVPHSVNVNEAFFEALSAAHPDALIRAAELDLALTTCVGLAEPVEAYRLARGFAAELVAARGSSRRAEDAVLYVKRTPESARVCGGIGTWQVPAAQIGASFFAGATVVFDPFRGEVSFR